MPDLSQKPNKWALVSIASEMGFIIALPLLLFVLAGKWLDAKVHDTFPWFVLVGLVLAIASTTAWLTKKLKSFIK